MPFVSAYAVVEKSFGGPTVSGACPVSNTSRLAAGDGCGPGMGPGVQDATILYGWCSSFPVWSYGATK